MVAPHGSKHILKVDIYRFQAYLLLLSGGDSGTRGFAFLHGGTTWFHILKVDIYRFQAYLLLLSGGDVNWKLLRPHS